MSEVKQNSHSNKSTTRRGFFRGFATSWGSALKTAAYESEYPFNYNNLNYFSATDSASAATVLTIAATRPPFPEGLGHMALCPQSIGAQKTTKNILAFIKEYKPTHTLWDCAVAPKGTLPKLPAVILNAPAGFKAKAPALFLFSQDQALSEGDALGQIVLGQPKGSDIYIGRIEEDLRDLESPTWQRLQLFFNNDYE